MSDRIEFTEDRAPAPMPTVARAAAPASAPTAARITTLMPATPRRHRGSPDDGDAGVEADARDEGDLRDEGYLRDEG